MPQPGTSVRTAGALDASEQPQSETAPPPTSTPQPAKTIPENLRVVGGLLALVAGLVALVIIVLVAIHKEPSGSAAAAGITAIASMVAAYFGVKVGSDGTKQAIEGTQTAIEGLKEEATKAQAFALAADPAQLKVIQAMLNPVSPQPGDSPLVADTPTSGTM